MIDIKWEMTGSDPEDLKADVGDGNMLRVERLGKCNYWWCVYYGDNDYHAYDNAGISLDDAMMKCQLMYYSLKYPIQ